VLNELIPLQKWFNRLIPQPLTVGR